MSNPPYPLLADPSEPGVSKDDDPVVQASQGHGDSVSDLGSEVGEASDDDVNHWIISQETVEGATENLHRRESPES